MDMQKRKKNYFSNNKNYSHRNNKQFILEPGIMGFFCTCNFREKDCIRDAYKLLNEFADNLYGSDKATHSNPNSKTENSSSDKSESQDWRKRDEDDQEDISTTLNREIDKLKAEAGKPVSLRRFQVVDTGVKNIVFIRTTLSDPLNLVTAIIEELDKTKKQRTRFLLRLLPIEVVCKADMVHITSKADVLFEKYFAQEPKTFSIVFNRHSNSNIQRNNIIEDLAEIIIKKNPGNKADLKNPELAVVVEVIRGLCLLSIAPNYFKYKKYNLLEICGVNENSKKQMKDSEITEEIKDSKQEITCEEGVNSEDDTESTIMLKKGEVVKQAKDSEEETTCKKKTKLDDDVKQAVILDEKDKMDGIDSGTMLDEKDENETTKEVHD